MTKKKPSSQKAKKTATRPAERGTSVPAARPPRIGVVVCSPEPLESSPPRLNLVHALERGVQSAGGAAHRIALVFPGAGPDALLPGRALLADHVEYLALNADLDGLLLVSERNADAAGLLFAAARLNKPAIFVPASPEVAGGGQYPARFAACLAEVMGAALPFSATAPAGSPEQLQLADAAGRRLPELVKQNFSIRRVLMANAFMNGLRLDAAFGGSTEAALFLLGLAQECGAKLPVDAVSEVGLRTPQVCRLRGEGADDLSKLHEAGGIPAVQAALKGQWLPHATVGGRGVNELSKAARVKDGRVIRGRVPYRRAGGLVALRGNLAAGGALFRVPEDFPAKVSSFTGPARVFDSREDALKAIGAKSVKKGDVVVVRYEGAKGGPGLRPLADVAEALRAQGLAGSTALVTDGAFGAPVDAGLAVELAAPEATEGTTLSILRDGDRVQIDLTTRRVNAHLTDTDTKVRLARWQAPASRARNGYLARFARAVGPALEGAVLK